MIRRLILALALIAATCFVYSPAGLAGAPPPEDTNPPTSTSSGSCDAQSCLFKACQDSPGSAVCQEYRANGNKNLVSGNNGAIKVTAKIIATLGGIAAVIMIIISGFMFATAGGSPVQPGNTNKTQKARMALISGVAGLAIIALAYSITNFVIDHFVHS